MDKNLESYVKVYKNVFSDEFCKQAIEELRNLNFEEHRFHQYKTDTITSYDKELSVSYQEISREKELYDGVWNSIHNYIVNDFKFEWFSAWNGFVGIRFNQYKTNTQMKEHCDHIHSMFDGTKKGIPILSIVGVLNEDYEGGEFIMWQDTKIELGTGDILIFPSNFLYPHQVTEVTKGTRNTFVTWVW
jgi:predicted 2-oxoglutarate/Fe(II)-dependent dioxygenase YbiX